MDTSALSPRSVSPRSVLPRRSLFIAGLAMGLLLLTLTGLRTVVAGPNDATSQPATTTSAATAPAPQFAWVCTPMRVLDLPGTTAYFSKSTRTMVDIIGVAVENVLPPLLTAQRTGEMSVDGGYIFVYHSATMRDGTPFTLEVGAPVIGKPKPIDGYAARELAPLHAAVTVYSGPAQHMNLAYAELYAEIAMAGLVPSGENRETYLSWESPESPNNVVMIAVGIR